MNTPLRAVFDFCAQLPWTIPAMGIAVACFAFVVGRHFLGQRHTPRAGGPAPAPPVDVFLQGGSMERRTAPRRKGNSVEVYFAEAPNKDPIQGWVVDRSVGGLCLVIEQPLSAGAVWHVKPRNGSPTTPWTAVEVRSCRAENGNWEIGCRFVQTPQWNVMLLFG